ncbi:uncharacterized protein [Elaeis guineensis]|uniref:Uncharacterized protein LOC105050810 n=1 Tax=Elaeis guineensis var. tenera TaxID=51953 RepID=A0A6I9RMN9_ELAGV|nr:uncharacterized protein LOC105050810 [Elaeis guineensis]XP_029122130.1 uncharacterized protein LOC105050810 [Elaeis guineensis]
MGTKLHGNHNVFTALLNNNHHVVTIDPNTSGNWDRFKNILLKEGNQTAFNCIQELSMDTFQNNRESIRNTMLRQEEIFRQQVQDLHRLYSVQKMLMAEIRSKQDKLQSPTIATSIVFTDTKTRFRGSTSTSETSHSSHVRSTHHSTAHLNSEYSSLHHYHTRAGPSSRELSIYSEDPLRAQKGFDLGQPSEDRTFTEVGHTQDHPTNLGKHLKEKMKAEGSDLWPEDESDVDLTLSIGCGTDKKRSKHWPSLNEEISFSNSTPSDIRPLLLSTTSRPGRAEECGDHSTGFDRESLQTPPWLFQALDLNKT